MPTPDPSLMRAFIIRPFGKKNAIDFDKVEAQLIGPALDKLNIGGRTTAEILRQGNIREDMFQRLLTADLVVADLSIHNANVFYELGIRHAFRDKRTFLLRCQKDEVPFDLRTDRYFSYNGQSPQDSLEQLVAALQQTLASEKPDSPIFQLLPGLKPQPISRFLPVPIDFQEEGERAMREKLIGDLELLAEEAQGLEWGLEGMREVGRAQYHLEAYEGAKVTWEGIRKTDPMDVEANTLLGTIYQRLGDLTRSDQAIQRVMKRETDTLKRAECQALSGRNEKSRWLNSIGRYADEERRHQALQSPFLERAIHAYAKAFQEDLNHFYSGLNTLGMVTIYSELAKRHPDVWEASYGSQEEAAQALTKYKHYQRKLVGVVDLSIKAAARRLKQQRQSTIWAEVSQADLLCLTSKRPLQVASAYRKALVHAPDFVVDSVCRQLELYRDLGIVMANVEAALALESLVSHCQTRQQKHTSSALTRVLIFTGHMIDKPDRPTPRFPPEKEAVAREAIKEAIANEIQVSGGIAYGLAGGACGGDMIFHEVCSELGIPTRLFLALPKEAYITESVAHGGPQWVERFHHLYQQLSQPVPADSSTMPPLIRVLGDSKQLPRWLQPKSDYSIWQRNNLWMLHNAMASGATQVTLLALWDGKTGDGPGGTGDLVEKAQHRGAKVVRLDTKKLFGL